MIKKIKWKLMRFCNMAPFILAFQKFNACWIRRLYVDVMTNGTERFQPSSMTLNWTSTYGSFIFHHGELRSSHNVFVSSNWTQRIRSLVNFIIYLEPPYLLDYNYNFVGFKEFNSLKSIKDHMIWSITFSSRMKPWSL